MADSDKYVARATYTDQELLNLWRECDAAISQNQEYEYGDRVYRRTDAREVTAKILMYEQRIAAATAPSQILARMVRR
jgi:hypothetical protein